MEATAQVIRRRQRAGAFGLLLVGCVVVGALLWTGMAGRSAGLPSSWLVSKHDQAVLIQWSQTGGHVNGKYFESALLPPQGFRQSELALHGSVSGNAIRVKLEGGGTRIALCGTVSKTRLVLDQICGESTRAISGPTQWTPGSRVTYEAVGRTLKQRAAQTASG
jgi:hypothetical protein